MKSKDAAIDQHMKSVIQDAEAQYSILIKQINTTALSSCGLSLSHTRHQTPKRTLLNFEIGGAESHQT